MAEQAKVPAIRFAGFTDPWEQRKASEVFQIVDDRGHPTLPVLSATQNQGMIYRDDSGRYIGHDESNEIGYKRVLPGDFVVHLRSFQGGFAHSQYEGITSPAYTVFRAKEPTSHSDRFWKHWFMSEHFIAGLSTVTYGIRDGRSISVDEFMNTFLAFPAVEEQAAISRLFDYLDDLITLHQRKYDKLVIFKKSMLEKMFPKDGESVPEIRFAGFTDPWEQRQLGELVTTTIGGGTPSTSNPAYWDGEIPWIQSSNVLEDTLFDVDIPKAITQKGLEESAAQIVPENSIAVVTHVGVGKLIYLPFQYSTSQDFISLCGLKGDARYTCYALWKRLQEDLHIVQGSAIKGITKEDLLEKNLPMPSVEEQAQIGVLFSQLDNLITLHQRKLELLQNIKKSLLDKMFV
ncbi:restriction endonuclease S subunit [Bifidobacterium longum subsp. longum]|uniref:restriction endonuclease subunit S n=1 Tax=Bifidobacterium longum TaxID=216816 RepID=UPI0010D3B21D|nr:restriction endonuclease S subunit [Bifidobacterium longum subsp. longum]